MKFAMLALVIALLLAPAVFAVHEQNNQTAKKREFRGLTGIYGVSVEEPERPYGPQKPFGKPRPKRLAMQAPLPPGYRGLGGIAVRGPSFGNESCAAFNCGPFQNVVADTSTKTYYRCRCPLASAIPKERLKCLATPALAEKIGYTPGPC